jgi:hypothetical protein
MYVRSVEKRPPAFDPFEVSKRRTATRGETFPPFPRNAQSREYPFAWLGEMNAEVRTTDAIILAIFTLCCCSASSAEALSILLFACLDRELGENPGMSVLVRVSRQTAARSLGICGADVWQSVSDLAIEASS